MKKPNFFIVGAPKCGTTALFTYLGEHPEIYIPNFSGSMESRMGGKKELNFFGKDLPFGRPSLEEYLAYYQAAQSEKHLGEASVFYLYSQEAAREIHDFDPSAHIIMMLRNPVDMMYSWHSQLLFWGDENLEIFESALNAEPERRKGQNLPEKRDFPLASYLYRDIAKYAEQIERYLNIFERKQIHIIIFDDFKKDTKSTYQGVLSFLGGIDTDFEPEFKVVNANKSIRNRKLQKFLRHQPGFSKSFIKTLIPSPVRRLVRDKLQQYNTKSGSRKILDTSLRNHLIEEFRPEIEKLSALLNRDFSYWIN